MTYKEYITATTARFGLTEADVDLLLINQNLIGEDDVDVTKAKTAMCKEFATLIPLQNVSEGGYSITWNIDAVKLWYHSTCAELGLTDTTKPRLRNRSNVW